MLIIINEDTEVAISLAEEAISAIKLNADAETTLVINQFILECEYAL